MIQTANSGVRMVQEWLQVLSLFLANAALILWFRSESRSDWKHMDNKVDAIQSEIKDFHGRLEKQDAEFKAFLMKSHKE